MTLPLILGASVVLALLVAAGLLHLLNVLGALGRRIQDALAVAPLLDVVVFYFTIGPAIAAVAAWRCAPSPSLGELALLLLASVVGQCVALTIWSWLHELARRESRRGPRILHITNRAVGPVRNYIATWWTALAVPIFAIVRLGELIVYPPLTWLAGLPKYKTADWVNVSRHKFSGLVGWDLVWCLYCDWMTGIWSLATEMLRNVETFWCPIRFASPEKCENCSIDFPDVAKGWIPADGNMSDVTKLIEKNYPGPGGVNAWFGHPVRLTVKESEKNAAPNA